MSDLDVWSTAIERDCPNCGVKKFDRCVNPITGRERRIPCWQRDRVSEEAPYSDR